MSLENHPTPTMLLKAVVLLLPCLYVAAQMDLQNYRRVPTLDNYQCLEADLVLSDDTGLHNSSCAGMCSGTANCSSFFYSPSSKHCRGCHAVYSAWVLHPAFSGGKYFARKSGYGQTCNVQEECVDDNTGCYDNVCVCQPGYPRDDTAGECATGCATWGDTFTMYPFSNLWVPEYPIIGAYETLLLQSFLPDACLEVCRTSPTCRSMDHSSVALACEFNDVTAAGAANCLWDPIYFHYSRNCA